MSLNATAIAVMVAQGMDAAGILAVAEALEIKRDRTGAERQARYRERNKVTRDVTRDESDVTASPQSPPLKSTPDPEKITPPLTPQPIVDGRAGFPPPEGVEKGQWQAFRRQRKKAINERSYLMICNKLKALAEDGWPPGEMIDLAVERGWETVFAPRNEGNGRRSGPPGIGKSQAAYAMLGLGNEH